MVGLRKLILGSVQSCLGLRAEAVSSLRAALSARQHLPNTAQDSHVSAFALYELARLLLQETYEVKTTVKMCSVYLIYTVFRSYVKSKSTTILLKRTV